VLTGSRIPIAAREKANAGIADCRKLQCGTPLIAFALCG
jgi:hypothetical protein